MSINNTKVIPFCKPAIARPPSGERLRPGLTPAQLGPCLHCLPLFLFVPLPRLRSASRCRRGRLASFVDHIPRHDPRSLYDRQRSGNGSAHESPRTAEIKKGQDDRRDLRRIWRIHATSFLAMANHLHRLDFHGLHRSDCLRHPLDLHACSGSVSIHLTNRSTRALPILPLPLSLIVRLPRLRSALRCRHGRLASYVRRPESHVHRS
jgi:hypothetical protein